MQNYVLYFFLLFLPHTIAFAQSNVETEIDAKNAFELSIIDIFPDSFPEVSVVFQAKNSEGKPLWELGASEVNVYENGENCEVLSIKNISKNKPVNVGLIFDHSGSMDYLFEEENGKLKEYRPIDFAKNGILNFLEQLDLTKDSILFVGFSTEVDIVLPITNKVDEIRNIVKTIDPDGYTAFYDAMFVGVEKLNVECKSSKVLVALTDGQDNSSKHDYDEVINFAKENGVSIYVIGLGSVNEGVLSHIAGQTDGFYYHTNDPNNLTEIYLQIKDQIQSIYELEYASNLDFSDTMSNSMKFEFVNDTLKFLKPYSKFELPEEVQAYILVQEEKRLESLRNRNLLLAGLGIGILALGFGFVIRKNKKEAEIVLANIYPNPFQSEINAEFKIPADKTNCAFTLTDISGNIKQNNEINSTETSIKVDTLNLSPGVYIAQVTSSNGRSNSKKIVKK
jgi:Ca-activated chloride channel family protein